ncbi:hypothetical protein A3Q56_06193 [Intoshia linei]|uniref:Uncharacterized protein n=1 Tax=Intoshia linei TaxID=1819745 RepID=A0A177AVR1_9BILA|nr:hypothetical protein A3Q56_06193 [Intoshia linei]
MELRNTPTERNFVSPAQIVLGRNISIPFIPQSLTNANRIRKDSVHTAKNHRKLHNN